MLNTIQLNNKNYSTVNAITIDEDLYDVNDFIIANSRTYYANKHNKKGVAKNIRRMMSV